MVFFLGKTCISLNSDIDLKQKCTDTIEPRPIFYKYLSATLNCKIELIYEPLAYLVRKWPQMSRFVTVFSQKRSMV